MSFDRTRENTSDIVLLDHINLTQPDQQLATLDTGNLVWQIEHEVRSLRHPLFARPLVNCNAQQSNSAYVKGHDSFRGSF